MSESPAHIWSEFRLRFQRANEHLVSEMAAAGEEVRSLIDRMRAELSLSAADQLKPGQNSSLERLFGELENRLFSGPLGAFQKFQPMGRTLSAIERHRIEMGDLARWLPPMITVSGPELVEMLAPDVSRGWRRAWLKRRNSLRPVKLREIVASAVQRQLARRAHIDSTYEIVLAQAGLHLLAAWQVYRRRQLAALVSAGRGKTAPEANRKWWPETAASLSKRTERFVLAYRDWAEEFPVLLGGAVLRRMPELSKSREEKFKERWQTDFSLWHRQQRGVRAVIELERQLSAVAREAIQAARQELESLRHEHDDVTGEMDRAVAWLEDAREHGARGVFPPSKAALFSAEQRTRDWSVRVSSSVKAGVPTFVETLGPVRLFSRWREPWRELHPQVVLLHALEQAGQEAARGGFQEAEREHTSVVRDIEQARQVIKFAHEAQQAEGESAGELPREAAANALSLLQHRREILVDPQVAAEAGLCRAQALVLLQTHTSLEIGRLGLLALLTRQGAPLVAQHLRRLVLGSIQAAARTIRKLAGEAFDWTAWKLGWKAPVATRVEPLVERARLSATLAVQLRARELPALYQRMFSLDPVEDERFLVGRETEMTGLNRAFSLWQSGRSVSVLLVGARGSGKTSLLNCAASAAFTGVPVMRGKFCQRIRSSEQMCEFLREFFQFPAGTDLVTALNRERRVAIIEELERTFLRCISGFDSLRGFLDLVATTSGSVLWILSMNQASFRYLDAVLGLGRNFSHCVNAMSVSQEQVVDAIMQRHTLSGLRLQFAPTPSGDPRLNRLQRFFGLERTSQQLFFDALYRHSEGLFRAAFELWTGSIERIEGGVVHMLHPLEPRYSRLEAELRPDDLFTLQAILQHASLTEGELAEVFWIGVEEARSQLERLLALEILEPEPACAGLRVRPQAGRFVRDALSRQNLL